MSNGTDRVRRILFGGTPGDSKRRLRNARSDEDTPMPDAPANGSALERLPSHILSTILIRAGLPCETRVNLNWNKRSKRGDDPTMHELWFDHNSGSSARKSKTKDLVNLMLVCRQFYTVVIPIVYGTNHICIHWRNGATLEGLANLSTFAIQHIRKLMIILNNSGPVLNVPNAISQSRSVSDKRMDELLSVNTRHYMDLSTEWERLASRLSREWVPGMVWLDFICDCADSKTASEILEPLFLFPEMKHVFVRLSNRPDPTLQSMAREIVLRLVKKLPPEQHTPFPFMRMPKELRMHTLSFTDLVSPAREVQWNPKEKYHLAHEGLTICNQCQCYECPGGVHPRTIHWFMYGVKPRDARAFCSRYCSGFEASHGRFYSPTTASCLCWQPPTPLFLVSKTLLEDARQVFYSRNRIIIKPMGDIMAPAQPEPKKVHEICRFLKNIPLTSMHSLRNLEIVYPFFEGKADFTRANQEANQTLRTCLEAVKPHLNMRGLTVALHMADYTTYRPSDKSIWRYAKTPPELTDGIMANHVDSALAFKVLVPELKRFYVFLHRPWRWPHLHDPLDTDWLDLDKSYDFSRAGEVAQAMERAVMGQDYKSSEMGKLQYKMRPSTWEQRLNMVSDESGESDFN